MASDATSEPAVPIPSRARPKIRTPGLTARANTTVPTTVIAAPTIRQSRGPKRSSAMPNGICTAAKTKKNALDRSPILGRREDELRRQGGCDDADRIAQELADDVDRDQRGDERDGNARACRSRSA